MLLPEDLVVAEAKAKKAALHNRTFDEGELLSEAYFALVLCDIDRTNGKEIDNWDHMIRGKINWRLKRYILLRGNNKEAERYQYKDIDMAIIQMEQKYSSLLMDLLSLLKNDLQLEYLLQRISGWTDEDWRYATSMNMLEFYRFKATILKLIGEYFGHPYKG